MIISPHTFELSLKLLPRKYEELLSLAYANAEGSHRIIKLKEKSGDYCTVHSDKALASHGITVEYRKSYLWESVKLIVNPSKVLGGDDIPKLWKPTDRNIKALIRELKTHIKDYFDSEFKLNDFKLTRVDLTANIDVGSRKNVSRYIKILHCMGRVKGFTPKYKKTNQWIDKTLSFDLKKTSPYIEFSAYDKEAQSGMKAAKGILRIEIRLMRVKTKKGSSTLDHIKDASKNGKDIFMNFFQRIVPRGDYYAKKQAISLIEDNITEKVPHKRERDNTLSRMKTLIELIPKKKSLHLAQQSLGYRDIGRIMDTFAELDVSPVTIPKSMKLKYLESLYSYLEE